MVAKGISPPTIVRTGGARFSCLHSSGQVKYVLVSVLASVLISVEEKSTHCKSEASGGREGRRSTVAGKEIGNAGLRGRPYPLSCLLTFPRRRGPVPRSSARVAL